MASGSLKDTTKLIKSAVTSNPTPRFLSLDNQKAIDTFLAKHTAIEEYDSQRLQDELVNIHSAYIAKEDKRMSVFLHALQLLRPALSGPTRLEEWWKLVIGPVVNAVGRKKDELHNACGFLHSILDYDEDEPNENRMKESQHLAKILVDTYLRRTTLSAEDTESNILENDFIARQLEEILVTFGRKKPKDFLLAIDRIVVEKQYRMQALGLLSAFVRHQPPHLHLVSQTPLIEHLLKCLLIDTSTTAISLALTTLIMFLPHIPSSVVAHLPRLFLIYSRILCWERSSPAATAEAKKAVQAEEKQADESNGVLGVEDTSWEKLTSSFDGTESTTPELINYFTFLYGLYPLNFTSYIRKPRKYLKTIEFPRADDFDLDQSIIRTRTEQYRRQHLMHPNFYNTTAEDELKDNRWLKSDPAEVVAGCIGLFIAAPSTQHDTWLSLQPAPTNRLPELPGHQVRTDDIPPQNLQIQTPSNDGPKEVNFKESFSITTSNAGRSRHMNGDSPTLPPAFDAPNSPSSQRHSSTASFLSTLEPSSTLEHFPIPGSIKSAPLRSPALRPVPPSEASIASLKREVLLLRNDLNLERYLKQQHLSYIGALQRQQIKDATLEAETQELVNSNRALKAKLAKVEETNALLKKETATGRSQSKKFENELSARLRSMKTEERRWRSDEENLRLEMQKASHDCDDLRRLIVESEARELLAQQQVTSMQYEMEQMDTLQNKIVELEKSLHAFEAKDVEFGSANAAIENLQTKLTLTDLKLRSRDAESNFAQRPDNQRKTQLSERVHLEDESHSSTLLETHRSSVSPNSSPTHMRTENSKLPTEATTSDFRPEYAELQQQYAHLEAKYRQLKRHVISDGRRENSWRPRLTLGNQQQVDSNLSRSDHQEQTEPSSADPNDLQDLAVFLPAHLLTKPSSMGDQSASPSTTDLVGTQSVATESNAHDMRNSPENEAYDWNGLDDSMSISPTNSASALRYAPAKAAKLLGEPTLLHGNYDLSGTGLSGYDLNDDSNQELHRSESAFSADSVDDEKPKSVFGWKRSKSGTGSIKDKEKEKEKDGQRGKSGHWFKTT